MAGDAAAEAPIRFLVLGASGNTGSRIARLLLAECERARVVLAGRNDVLVDLDTSIRQLSDRLGPDSRLEIIDRADHFHFCDAIEMLHKMHENNPRENQLHPTRPIAELRDERDMHRLLNERVVRFFSESLGMSGTSPQ